VEPADPAVEAETRQRFEAAPEAAEIIDELHVRMLTRGGAPAATLLIFELSDEASSADRAGIVRGFEEGAGSGEPINLGPLDGTLFNEEGVLTVITTTPQFALMVVGDDKAHVEAVARGAALAVA
jgi:hypothetical protein